MNIKDLQVFLHLSQSLHFGHTAAALHTSPSTLSRIIQRLEDEFDQRFFERDNRSVRLTKAGYRFVEFAENTVSQWQLLRDEFDANSHQLVGEISIYCTVTAAHLYLPAMVERFRQLHSRVEINIETGDVAAAYQKVSDKMVDFAFAVAPEKIADKFCFQHLHQIPFKLIAPKQLTGFSQWLKKEPIAWNKLPFVMPESGPAALHLKQWLQQMGVAPQIYAQVSGHEAIVSMTALGCGVSAVPLPVLENSPVKDKVEVIPVEFTPKPFELGMLCLQKRLESPVINEFWKVVLTYPEFL